uniref:Uncharacterized protein n=1 Tax=Sphaerodactylus townsendi TaxID=933632 RepID=A0ACB8EJY1_9SAUR
MAIPRSKAQHKTSREKKTRTESQERADMSQKKRNCVEESKARIINQQRRESTDQANSEEVSSDEDIVMSVQGTAKSKKDMKLKDRRENHLKRGLREKRDKEVCSGRRHGEQLTFKGEETQGKVIKQDNWHSQSKRNINTKSNEPKDIESQERHSLKKTYKGQASKKKSVPDTESLTVESEEVFPWRQESHQRSRQVESREQCERKSHYKASRKAARSRSRGCRKTHIRKSIKIFSKAHPVNSDDSSFSDSQGKYNWNPRGGDKENKTRAKKNKPKTREGRRHSLEADEVQYRKKELPAIVETQLADERRGCQGSHNTSSESEGNLEAAIKKQESQYAERDPEIEEKIKGKKKRYVPRKAISNYNSEQGDDGGSDNHSGSNMEEEYGEGEHENSSEKRSSEEGSDCEQSKPGSEEDENEISSLAKIGSDNKEGPFCSTTRSKLPKAGFSKLHQENHPTEENVSVPNKLAGAASSAHPTMHKRQSFHKPVMLKQNTCLEDEKRQDGCSGSKNRIDAIALFAKRYNQLTSQSQILLNLKSKLKNDNIDASSKYPLPKTAEIDSDLEKTQNMHSQQNTTSNNQVISRDKASRESRSSFSTVSSSCSHNKNLSAEKEKAGKVTGKVSMTFHQALETREEEEMVEKQIGEDAENDLLANQTRSRSLCKLSAFRKITHWLTHNPLKKTALKDRFLSAARAVGISGWLFKKLGKMKRIRKPFEFRRRMALRIVSTAGLAKRCNKTSCDSTTEQMKDLCNTGASLLKSDYAGDENTQITEELVEGEMPSSNFPCNEDNVPPQRSPVQLSEEKNVIDAKSAVVFPRVHQLVMSKNASLGSSCDIRPLKQSWDQSRRKAVMSVQPSVEEGVSQHPAPSNMEKEDVRSMTDFIQRAASEAVDQVHWTQQQSLGCDPVAWLNSETLLPRLTVENLSKWTIYTEQNLAKKPRSTASRERWETEDAAEDILEMDFAQKQKYKDEDCCLELQKVEDLLRLEHIFAITEMAYTFSQNSEQEQCIVISGHSGSGKTEAAKAIVLYLSRLYQQQENYGKKQSRGERSFNVFYELLAGLSIGQKEELYLQEAETYFYLNQASE